MIQAGRLIMDGRTFALTLWIDNIASHKAIAVKSHLCLIYLELTTAAGAKRYVATAVTAGDLKRIYIGKPAFFIDSEKKQYNGKIVDMVAGPISFWQTVFEPFRRLGAAIGSKTQKLTDYSSTEKAMSEKIDSTSDRLTSPKKAPAPAQNSGGGLLGKGNGTMLLLAGGLSIAALGAAISYVAKTIASGVRSMLAMPPWQLAQFILIVLLILFAPLALYAILQLRKRNLTLFLEAAGWAINLPMKLNSRVSRFFTFFGIYPDDAKFKMLTLGERNPREDRIRRRRRRIRNTIIVVIILLLIGGHYWMTGKIQQLYHCIKIRCSAKRGKNCSVENKATAEKSVEKAAPGAENKSNVDDQAANLKQTGKNSNDKSSETHVAGENAPKPTAANATRGTQPQAASQNTSDAKTDAATGKTEQKPGNGAPAPPKK